jgi:hypothetical protein
MFHLHYVSFANSIANSVMFFSKNFIFLPNNCLIYLYIAQATAFGYGITLIKSGEMQFQNVFRIFAVITFASTTLGRSASMVPNYSKGKQSAKRIFQLNSRQSKIDPHNPSGIKLVDILKYLY